MLTLTILVLSSVFAEARGGENPNLIRNPSFESPNGDAWTGIACSLEEYSGDKTDGRVSAICKDRKKDQAGPEQVLPSLIPGRGYELSADVKLLNDHPDKLFQKFKATISFQFNETAVRGVDSRQPELSARKPPSCKGLKGEPRTKCLAQRASWKNDMKKRREEKLKKKQERKRLKEERRRKNKQRKKETMERKKKKKAEQEKARKEKGRRRKQKKREKQKRDKEKPRRRKPRRRIDRHREARSLRRHVTDHVTSAGDGSRRQVLPPLSRQRRQVRRQRVEPPKTIHRKGRRKIYPEDAEPKPASGAEEEEGTFIIAWRAWGTTDKGWIKLKGSISTPLVAFNASILRIQGPDPECNFLIDNVRFVEIDENPDWLAESRVRIDTHRKSDIELKVHIPDDVPKAEVDVQVRLKKHLFAFGSKVEDKFLRGSKKLDKKFQELFFTLFNWATLGSFKWRFDKGNSLYEPVFSDALGGLEKLREHGINVRAHSILWGVRKNVPDAVIKTPPGELQAVVDFHTEYMVNITHGRVEHWDVQNELLHGHWYEETLKDPDFTKNLFKHVRRLDPYPKLYLNDFQGVTAGGNTEDLYDTAMDFIAAGTGIQGLGIQGHTKEFTLPHPTLMWRRLDRLQQTGLDIFMTEFDVGWLDDVVRADWFEDAMRAFYAHPALSGVILWGFWERMQRFKHKYLVIGDDFQFAEPGQRWVCLVKKEWTTNETFNMADLSGDTIQLRGFQGDYEVVVRRNGVPVRQKNFTLGTRHKSVSIHVSRHGDPIELTEERDYVPECISHRDRKSLGEVYTTSSNSRLSCFEKGPDQAPSGASRVTATCPPGSVMIGCSSYSKARSSKFWHGEEIQIEGGVAICSAHIDPSAGAEPTVKALCCDQKDLTCDYRQAGPSYPMKGAMAEATCPTGHTALACTASSEFSHISGSYPNSNLTSCRAVKSQSSSKDPRSQAGVVSGAVCCKSWRALSCRTVTSAPSAPNEQWVNVTCPSGYDVMTGCHAHALNGGTAGSYVYKRDGPMSCSAAVAEDHPEKDGAVVAVAVCCRP